MKTNGYPDVYALIFRLGEKVKSAQKIPNGYSRCKFKLLALFPEGSLKAEGLWVYV